MQFILQTRNGKLDMKEMVLKYELDKPYVFSGKHEYILSESSITHKEVPSPYLKHYIPCGNIPFVEEHLKTFFNIDRIKVIEIPKCLQTEEFLKRNYIITKSKNEIPIYKDIFIKKMDRLKEFSYIKSFSPEMIQDLSDGTYIYSDVIKNILSEYRIIVYKKEIIHIGHYLGDCTILPDINLVKKAINIYESTDDVPFAYTIDIGVYDKGTFIIEIHNYSCVGNYGFMGDERIIELYSEGYRYLIKK